LSDNKTFSRRAKEERGCGPEELEAEQVMKGKKSPKEKGRPETVGSPGSSYFYSESSYDSAERSSSKNKQELSNMVAIEYEMCLVQTEMCCVCKCFEVLI
jgi:hypothetical protein